MDKNAFKAEAREMFRLSNNLNFTLQVNCIKIRELVDNIDRETGTRSPTYNINIKPEIHVTANVNIQTIDENFTPELTVAFKTGTEKGNYIAIENLQQTRTGRITETEEVPLPQAQTQRTASYVATTATTIALAASAFLYLRHRPPLPPEKTLEDLAKIAETLARPIFHTRKDEEHVFYIIDNSTKYQYKTKT